MSLLNLGVLPSRKPRLIPCGGDKLDRVTTVIILFIILCLQIPDVQLRNGRVVG